MQNADHHTYPFGSVPKRLTDFFWAENRDFVGRTDELALMHQHLREGQPTLLIGMGGIGKTTLARKYIELHWQDYHHVAWLTVTAPQAIGHNPHLAAADAGYSPLRDAFLRSPALWQSLGVAEQVEQRISGKDLEGAFQILSQRLGQLQGCLLVLDNANDAADLLENRPALKSMNAHVLLTTRAKPKGWAAVVPVDELPLPKAIALFRQHYAHPSLAAAAPADLEWLAETLLRHTLLLELVGKSASPNGANLPLPRLLESLRDHSFHAQPLNEVAVDAGDHADGQNLRRQATVEGYISLIFNHISHLHDDQRDLLKAMTLLPPATAYDCEILTTICQQLGLEFQQTRAETLAQYGWLRREPLDEGGVGYFLHPLMLDVAFRELGVTAEWADAVIDRMGNIINYDNTNPQHDLREKRKLQPYGEHLGKLFWEAETAAVSWLLGFWAELEIQYGFYANAAHLEERALEIAEKNGLEEIIAVRQSNLAIVYRYLGEYARARDLLEAALASAVKNFGPEHPSVATSQSNLALVYSNLGEYAQASNLLEAALASDLKNFAPEHPNIAVSQSNLGDVYRELGEYARACNLLEAALASAVKNFGPEHPTVALHQSNLANVYRNLGEYARARELLEAALASDLKNFGPEHPNIAVRQSNLANVYRRLGEHARARSLLETALQSAMKNFGAEHPNVAVSRNNLAHVYFSERNYPAAVEQFEEALRIVEKALGREHPYFKMGAESLEVARRAARV